MSLLIFSERPGALADFYAKVLDTEPNWSGGDFKGFKIGATGLAIGPHEKVRGNNMQPERIIVNFETANVKEECERLKAMGAKVIAEPYQPAEDESMWVATFEDPDGNYFQITTPFEAK